jgi:hypothetical protein
VAGGLAQQEWLVAEVLGWGLALALCSSVRCCFHPLLLLPAHAFAFAASLLTSLPRPLLSSSLCPSARAASAVYHCICITHHTQSVVAGAG